MENAGNKKNVENRVYFWFFDLIPSNIIKAFKSLFKSPSERKVQKLNYKVFF